MKLTLVILISVIHSSAFAQFYLRGEVSDEKGKPLPNVNIRVQSTSTTYKSGYDGSFGLPSKKQPDSLFFSFDGYESVTKIATAKQLIKVSLKKLSIKSNLPKNELHSFIQNVNKSFKYWTIYNETYTSLVENPFVKSSTFPVTAFSANTNRASYSNIRRFINELEQPPPDAVRIEEMLNYFNLNYHLPEKNTLFNVHSTLSTCPWNKYNQLLFLNLSARSVITENIPPNNFVFLIDVSGSMDVPNKLPLIKSGLKMVIRNMRPIDTVSIVTYGSLVRTVLEGISGNEKELLIKGIDDMVADGDTPGEAAIKLSYQIARRRYNKSANNRIILATDGDFNVGSSSEKDLSSLIEKQKNAGIYLTCLGVGMGNYKDSKLAVLAQTGKGNFAYIDSEQEAEKIFITEFTQTLYAVADNVYITLRMNTDLVKEYRLIGFDNKRKDMADTTNKMQGGEIGAGQSVMAIFEIKPAGIKPGDTLTSVEVHYKMPGQSTDTGVIHFSCSSTLVAFENIDPDLKKATGIALFGLKLKQSEYIPQFSWKRLESFAYKYFNKNIGKEKEFLMLVSKSFKLYRKKWISIF